MTSIQKLMEELCPDGVEYKKLGEIGTFVRGNGLQKKDFTESGVGCIHYGQIYTYYNLFTSQTKSFVDPELAKRLTKVETGDVIIACTSENMEDVCKAVAWLGDYDIVTGGHACVFKHKENPKYISYFLQTEDFSQQKKKYARGAKVIDIKAADLANIEIPVPPLAVQSEIVKYLDNFTELTAELTAELIARKKQYEYYRNKLLSFTDIENRGGQIETKWMLISEICSKITDGSHSSPAAVEEGYYMPSVKDMTATCFDYSNCKKISKADYDSLVRNGCKPEIGDVLIAKDGSMLKYAFPVEKEEDVVILSSIAILRPIQEFVTPKYLAHYFRQDSFKNVVIRDYSSKGGVPRIVLKNFKKIGIPIPPLAEQERIVSILDRFEKLTNDITKGIPAEIKARQQQYEYYRNKLLTFKQKLSA